MEVSTIGLDIAKNVFQAHGADEAGNVVFRKQLHRNKLLEFFAGCTPCLVAMEACSGAHYWAREIGKLGHQVRLIPPSYVKPFVKRQKNDAADAEAICEAVQRPTMRFVAVKSESHTGEWGCVPRKRFAGAPAYSDHQRLARPSDRIRCGRCSRNCSCHSSDSARTEPGEYIAACRTAVLNVLIDALQVLEEKIKMLDQEIARRSRKDEDARRLATVPGIGPVTDTALVALAPAATSFRRGRDFAAWLGLTPRQNSTGGKQRLGATSKMGERTLRRLLILGACTVVQHSGQRKISKEAWLAKMLARKPRMLTIVALANKMARIVWALMSKGGIYQVSVGAVV